MPKRRKKKNDEQPDESWLLPYSDMLTLLVALFIVLFAMSDVDAQKYKELASVFESEFSGGNTILEESLPTDPSETPINDSEENESENKEDEASSNSTKELNKLKELQASIDNYILTNNLSEVLDTRLTNEGLFITILNDISFDSGSAEVKDEGIEVAREVSTSLDAETPHQVVISGHADDVAINNEEFRSNWELSAIRAVNFMGRILEDGKHNPTLFSARGYGEHQPIVPNTSAENRAKNRRVEILILPNYEININEN